MAQRRGYDLGPCVGCCQRTTAKKTPATSREMGSWRGVDQLLSNPCTKSCSDDFRAVFLLPRARTNSGWLEVDHKLDMGCQLLTNISVLKLQGSLLQRSSGNSQMRGKTVAFKRNLSIVSCDLPTGLPRGQGLAFRSLSGGADVHDPRGSQKKVCRKTSGSFSVLYFAFKTRRVLCLRC